MGKDYKEINPFIESLDVPFVKIVDHTEFKSDGQSSITAVRTTRVLGVRRVTVYRFDDLLEYLAYEAKPSTMKVVLYIFCKQDKDYIEMKRKTLSETLNADPNTIGVAIKELVDLRVLDYRSQSTYWVNINLVYGGDLIKYADTHKPDSLRLVKVINKPTKEL